MFVCSNYNSVFLPTQRNNFMFEHIKLKSVLNNKIRYQEFH